MYNIITRFFLNRAPVRFRTGPTPEVCLSDAISALRSLQPQSAAAAPPRDSFVSVKLLATLIAREYGSSAAQLANWLLDTASALETPTRDSNPKFIHSMLTSDVARNFGMSAQTLNRILEQQGLLYFDRRWKLSTAASNEMRARGEKWCFNRSPITWTQQGASYIHQLLAAIGIFPIC